MAVELDIGDVMTCRLNFRDANNTLAFNILHYELANVIAVGSGTPPFDGVDFAEVAPFFATELANNFVVPWALIAPPECKMLGATVQNIFPAPKSRQYTFNFDPPESGTATGEMLPLQDAPTLVKRSVFGQRWGIGRLFVVGVSETMQNRGLMTVEGVTLVNGIGDVVASVADITVGTYRYQFAPIIYGPNAEGGPRRLAILDCEISDPTLKTQRRRRPGKGI